MEKIEEEKEGLGWFSTSRVERMLGGWRFVGRILNFVRAWLFGVSTGFVFGSALMRVRPS